MLATGTTWEAFDSINSPGSSNCHAWTSHPAVHFANILAGVRQEGPAWKSIAFCPTFVPGIDHVSTKVPTPQGMIEASWRKEGDQYHGQVTIPEGVRARLRVPDRPYYHQTGGLWRF